MKKKTLKEAFIKAVLLEMDEEPDDYRQKMDDFRSPIEAPVKFKSALSGQDPHFGGEDPTSTSIGDVERKEPKVNVVPGKGPTNPARTVGKRVISRQDLERKIFYHIQSLPVEEREKLKSLSPEEMRAKKEEIAELIKNKFNLKVGGIGAGGVAKKHQLNSSIPFIKKVIEDVASGKGSPATQFFAKDVMGLDARKIPSSLTTPEGLSNDEVVGPYVYRAWEKLADFMNTRLEAFPVDVQDKIEQLAVKKNLPLGLARVDNSIPGAEGKGTVISISDIGRVSVSKLMSVMSPDVLVNLYRYFENNKEEILSHKPSYEPPQTVSDFRGSVEEPSLTSKIGSNTNKTFFNAGNKNSDVEDDSALVKLTPAQKEKKRSEERAMLAKKMVDPVDPEPSQDKLKLSDPKTQEKLLRQDPDRKMGNLTLATVAKRFAEIYSNDPKFTRNPENPHEPIKKVSPQQVANLIGLLTTRDKTSGKLTGIKLKPEVFEKLPRHLKLLAKDIVEKLNPDNIAKYPEFAGFISSELQKVRDDIPSAKKVVQQKTSDEKLTREKELQKNREEKDKGKFADRELSQKVRTAAVKDRENLKTAMKQKTEKVKDFLAAQKMDDKLSFDQAFEYAKSKGKTDEEAEKYAKKAAPQSKMGPTFQRVDKKIDKSLPPKKQGIRRDLQKYLGVDSVDLDSPDGLDRLYDPPSLTDKDRFKTSGKDDKTLMKELILKVKQKIKAAGLKPDTHSIQTVIRHGFKKGTFHPKYQHLKNVFFKHSPEVNEGKSMFMSIVEMLIDIGKTKEKETEKKIGTWDKAKPAKSQKFEPTLKEGTRGKNK